MDAKIDDDSLSDESLFEEDEGLMPLEDLFPRSSLLMDPSSPTFSNLTGKQKREGPTIPMKLKVGDVVRHHGSAFWIPFRKPLRRPESKRVDVVSRLQQKLGIPDHSDILPQDTTLSETKTERLRRPRQESIRMGTKVKVPSKGETLGKKRRAIVETTGRRSRVVKRTSRMQPKEFIKGKDDVASELARRRREHRRRTAESKIGQKKSEGKRRGWI
eukprot:TRINITY_DN82721_c0_g1_i1.p1 TRINITY_DN82721_c0_g1~~TRINITY_DN82721_c0_g1_i1.p1  ORF type:complete len:216 (-),score=60.14 TRINITY_DN82721_c0_g1_i1:174-821(-)